MPRRLPRCGRQPCDHRTRVRLGVREPAMTEGGGLPSQPCHQLVVGRLESLRRRYA